MKTISRYIMTLALLLTAVTGAWADGEIVVTVTAADLQADKSTTFKKDGVTIKCWDRMQEGLAFSELYEMSTTLGYFTKIEITNQHPEGISGINGISGFTVNGSVATWTGKASSVGLGHYSVGPVVQFVFTIEPAEPAIDVKWDAATKTGTFEMPAFDVEIAPIYAPTAVFATKENLVLTPTAAVGIYAESNDSIVTPGTVANIGETDNVQGTLMYAIGTSATEAPALTAFSATLPTAKDITAAGDVLVWYYIKGADTPDGQEATAENTFNDSEICETPLTVTVLNNKFDIQFNAANANTIEAGKATVKVGETAAEVKEGKLTGVKMNSKVTVTAKEGYKFRKVEVKKKGDGPLAAAFKDGAKFKVGYQWNFGYTTYLEFTNSGGTYSLTSVSGLNEANGFNSSTLTVKNGNVLALDVVCQPNGDRMDHFGAQIEFDATSSTYKYSSKGRSFTGIISVSVNDTDITSQLTEAK